MNDAKPLDFGDVLLVPFPFTDQAGSKRRPAVVVSSASYHRSQRRDVVIMALTSQVRLPLGFAEALVADWEAAGLVKPTVFKPVFTTIEQHLVIRRMGRLSITDIAALRTVMAAALG